MVEACQQLKKVTDIDYEVIFTLNGNENQDIIDLYKKVQNEKLPIRFEGLKTREEVFEAYAKSILLFPSYIETFGMPLLEVRMCQGVILAADTPFAKEILEDYENVGFFDAFNSRELSVLMCQYLQKQRKYNDSHEVQHKNNKTKLLIDILLNS
nr:glycosyltransferase [Bacillus cereus]